MKYIYLSILFIASSRVLISQEDCNNYNYFGRFCISMNWSPKQFYLYDKPNKDRKAYARFELYNKQTGPNSFTLSSKITFLKTGLSEENKAIYDFIHATAEGMVGMECSQDSLWFKVSLDYRKSDNPPSAWVYKSDLDLVGCEVVWWNNYFANSKYIYFQCDSAQIYYSAPSYKKRIYPLNNEQRRNYSMRAIKIVDDWMQVELFSPSAYEQLSRNDNTKKYTYAVQKKVWIKYLDKKGQPLIDNSME